MLTEFLEKITEWALEKEELAAKKCEIPLSDIEKQLKILEDKKEELQKKCNEQLKILDNLISRIEHIKVQEALRCENKKED